MKNLILLFTIVLTSFYSSQNARAQVVIDYPGVDAEFPGGVVAMKLYLAQSIKYPAIAVEQNTQGKVFVEFVVNEDGSISNIKTLRGVSPEIDREAERVIRMMPKWKPAESGGEPAKAKIRMPINFVLAKKEVRNTQNDVITSPQISRPPEHTSPVAIISDYPDEEAEFPGGMVAMKSYLARSIVYPKTALDNGDSGKVFIEFVVNTDGSISLVKILRGVSKEIDAEAKRVIKEMPSWIPGRSEGKVIRSRVRIPISFIFSKEK